MGLEQYGIPLNGSQFISPGPDVNCAENAYSCEGGFTKVCTRLVQVGVQEVGPYMGYPWRNQLRSEAWINGAYRLIAMGHPYPTAQTTCSGGLFGCIPDNIPLWRFRYDLYSGEHGPIYASDWSYVNLSGTPYPSCP